MLRAACQFAALCILLFVYDGNAIGQTAKTLSQVKKVYIELFGPETAATKLRDRTIEQLWRKGRLEIVNNRQEADAVIKGNASIWLTGYISTDPRSPSTMRQPVFQGFLSVELIGKDNDPLWSYLVTPGTFRTGDITNDLADRFVEKFLEARKQSESVLPTQSAGPTGEIVLTAAGATFPAPLYQKWFESFHERYPSVTIKYSPVGSEEGLQMLLEGEVDFGASDVRLSEERIARSNTKFLHFATVIGAVVPAYNLQGIGRTLNFTPEALAGIYLGKIRKWNDPAIQESNRDAALPDAQIVVVHRSDGSGTTFAWTDYLSKVSSEWKTSIGPGTEVHWPTGTGAQGNEAVAVMIQRTPDSIGYVELAYALQHELSFGAVRNLSGKFIQADLPSVTASVTAAAPALSSDSRESINNAPGKNAYPIATFTWWVIPQGSPGAKSAAIHKLVEWMLSSGQKECSALAYTPLPRDIVNQQLAVIEGLK
jgi:phosphate ABC transporter phosphate-binding protein